jgi:hypothetical protein
MADFHGKEARMAARGFAPVTLGEMLKEEFLAEYGLTQNRLAKAIGFLRTGLPKSSAIDGGLPLIPRFDSVYTLATVRSSGLIFRLITV